MKYLRSMMLVASLLSCIASFGQSTVVSKDYDDFTKSFRRNINYPVELSRNCVSSFCLLKIRFGPDKKITEMILSDGADSLLKAEFNANKKALNITALERVLLKEYETPVSGDFLIPIYFSFHQTSCPPQAIKIESLYNYLKFDHKELTGTIVLLPAIGSLEHIQR